jgi:hypothetical protein
MVDAKDLITEDNVFRTYRANKYVCFVLRNGFTVKLDPNKTKLREAGRQ